MGDTLYYGLSDHLGSTSVTIDPDGNKTEIRYKAWGEVRYQGGVTSPTDRTYTGQRSYADDFGLMYYNARWYDSNLGHFAQADNIDVKAGDTQSLDRFGYVSNNPISRTDPTGHKEVCVEHDYSGHIVTECHDDGKTGAPVTENSDPQHCGFQYAMASCTKVDLSRKELAESVRELNALKGQAETNAGLGGTFGGIVGGAVGAVAMYAGCAGPQALIACVGTTALAGELTALGTNIGYGLAGGREAANYNSLITDIYTALNADTKKETFTISMSVLPNGDRYSSIGGYTGRTDFTTSQLFSFFGVHIP